MLYNPPTGGASNDPFVGKNVAAGIQGSEVPPGAVEFPQREIINAISGSGQSPTNSDLTQLIQAIATGIDIGTFGGSANALTATIPGIAIPTLRTGMTFFGLLSATNTAAATLAISGFTASPGAKAIKKRDGTSDPAASDLVSGNLVAFRYDGTRFRHVGAASSDFTNIIQNSPLAGTRGIVAITTSGNFTVPANVYFLKRVRLWAAGGGGGGGSPGAGSGGGGGGYSEYINAAVTPGQVIACTVGSGGAGGSSSGGNGSAGGTTSFGPLISSTGGGGGIGATSSPQTSTAGAGGGGTGGSLVLGGSSGGFAFDIGGTHCGGIGGASAFGGGSPSLNVGTGGSGGNFPGGGGNGGASGVGGTGAPGLILIEY